jgi:hypothetical protein
LWWTIVPYVKKTRAPGMALYVVALVTAAFAAMGVERLERGEGKRMLTIAAGVAAFAVLLALAGVFGSMAESFARGQAPTGGDPINAARAAAGGIRIPSDNAGILLSPDPPDGPRSLSGRAGVLELEQPRARAVRAR